MVIIGDWTPSVNPTKITIPRPEKPSAAVLTYDSVAYFGWPATIVGKQILLEWDYMPTDEFESLDLLYQADVEQEFAVNSNSAFPRYNVNLLALDGAYHMQTWSGDGFRRDVKLALLIMSEV